ncbi:MAG: ShlB/FhaC/HecB family hemolysin secretion/activation protein [Brevundimonas sp.]|uniref:ShlB/FhaC/HecB family hemolysin secretion/activation protein n=1 Tax=Brevundimonas sp. TaxID=1871086 RepID=UPI00260383E9|nr:ShlB/FhaC/HecB family hemolysin secretion/activation protein [Brevundimonas sp.]MDI6623146.1 ShlB/FhaC/HecB family hemolysin secretion/activation protein [Brevundimonas sp.]MDQ7811129.1 ShlB/FhaC/HecB family hemolysin secretion/activation protein [Brevundimonas sp.]
MLAASQNAHAQVPPVGGQLQQIPPAATPLRPAPDIRIERPEAPIDAAAEGRRIRVDALRVAGATLFTEAELVAATGFTPGRELTLPELRNAAAQITRFYNSRGYVLAQAHLPAQDVVDGAVTIAVVEGRYGAIDLRNQAGVPDALAAGLLTGLNPGDPVAIAPLERRLLLLSDIPGVVVHSTLSPGAEVGSSDLTVDLTRGRRISGSLEADNAGNRYTGAYRFGGSVNFHNPTGMGDLISLRVLASTEGLAYGRAAWQAPLGAATIGVAWTHMQYDLGREFAALDAGGTADIFSVFASYPLIRSRTANLYAFASADAKFLSDEIGLVSQVSDKEIRALTVGLRGDSRDGFGGGGWNAGSLSWTSGDLDIEDPFERAADAVTARSQGGFIKLQYAVSRLQTVSGPLSVFGSLRGQVATDNLDASEKMELGGAYAVRAYPEGEAYGDEGYVATVEARLALDEWTRSLPGRFQLIGFVDTGEVNFAHDPWFPGSNHARRSGVGVGVNWSGPDDLFIRASYARRLGDQIATSGPDEEGRAWFQIVKLF